MPEKTVRVSRFGLPDSIRCAIPGIDNLSIETVAEHEPHIVAIHTDDNNQHTIINPSGIEHQRAEIQARRTGLGASGCPLYEVVSIELL